MTIQPRTWYILGGLGLVYLWLSRRDAGTVANQPRSAPQTAPTPAANVSPLTAATAFATPASPSLASGQRKANVNIITSRSAYV